MSLLFPSATRLKRQCTWVLRNKHDRCVAMAHEVSHWKRSIVSVKGFLSAEFLHHGTGLAKCKVKIATMALRCDKISSYNQDSVWSWFICFCTTNSHDRNNWVHLRSRCTFSCSHGFFQRNPREDRWVSCDEVSNWVHLRWLWAAQTSKTRTPRHERTIDIVNANFLSQMTEWDEWVSLVDSMKNLRIYRRQRSEENT